MQLIVEIFKKQAESSGADQSPCFEYVINCLRCCLACVERIVQFINKTAYIQIALRGKNFCMAAKDGFETVWSNGMRYLIVAGVGDIMMFIGKLMIAAGSTALFYCLITFVTTIKENIVEPIYLLVVIMLIAIDRFHHLLLHRFTVHERVQYRHGHHPGLFHRGRDESGGSRRKEGTIWS